MQFGILLFPWLSSLANTVGDVVVPGVLDRYTKSDGLSSVTGCNLLLHSLSRRFLGLDTAMISGFEMCLPSVLS